MYNGLLLRKTDHYQRKIRKPLMYAILIVTTVTSIVAVTFLSTLKMKTAPIVPNVDNSSDKELKWMMDKDDWGGIKTFEIPPLHHPVAMLIISHTESPYCNTLVTCSRVIRSVQAKHISQGYRDIGYNYLIGGDGNVYIGRGGDTESFHSNHKNHSLGISIVGDYDVNVLTDSMFINVIKLITCLRQYNILAPNYAIVAHNQTINTRSPGKNVYKVIKAWSHFVGGEIKNESVVVSNDTGDVLTHKWLRATKFCMSENVKVKTLL